MKSIEEQRAEKFYELRSNGTTVEEIADMYFLSVSRVSEIIAGYERKHQLPGSTPRAIKTDKRGEEFRGLRLKGVTLEDIASTYSLTRQRVDQIIKRYEHKYNLPNSTNIGKGLAQKARHADEREHATHKKLERQFQGKYLVETIQLDADLVGRFLQALDYRRLSYRFYGKNRRRRDGRPFPSNESPACVEFGTQEDGGYIRYKLHHWVLRQYGVEIPKEMDCHHIDGNVTNNMRENLQLLSNEEHGRLTIQEQRRRGTFDYQYRSSILRRLTIEQVEEIRALYKPGVTSINSLSKIYGTNWLTMNNAIYGLGAYSDVNPATRHVVKESDAAQILLDFGTQNP